MSLFWEERTGLKLPVKPFFSAAVCAKMKNKICRVGENLGLDMENRTEFFNLGKSRTGEGGEDKVGRR